MCSNRQIPLFFHKFCAALKTSVFRAKIKKQPETQTVFCILDCFVVFANKVGCTCDGKSIPFFPIKLWFGRKNRQRIFLLAVWDFSKIRLNFKSHACMACTGCFIGDMVLLQIAADILLRSVDVQKIIRRYPSLSSFSPECISLFPVVRGHPGIPSAMHVRAALKND